MTPEVIWSFLKRFEGMSYSHQRTTASIIRMYLAAHGNPAMLRMKLRLTGYARTHVDWLTPEEIEAVFRTSMTPIQMVMIGAGLLQGLRRIEMLRMTVGDAKEALKSGGILRVRGKGGKEREVSVHPDFATILSHYLAWRDPQSDTEPLLGISRTASEKALQDFCSRFGKKFTFHTMRRSFGRTLWLRGIPIETISTIYGHSSVDMTRRYLGIALSDMQKALMGYRVPRIAELQIEPAR
ncbi:MAG: tyrosine-type recombinase/integrase [Thermoplasmata archaeon]